MSSTDPDTDSPTNSESTPDTDTDSIERNAGQCVGGFMVGAGYRGKREDQDEAVQEFARRLDEKFPHDIDIRYNTDQLSGSAWLKDDDRNAQVGLGAKLVPPYWHRRQLSQYHWGDRDDKPTKPKYMDPDDLNLKFTVKLEVPAADEADCNNMTDRDDRNSYLTRSYPALEQAWSMFEYYLNPDGVNSPGTGGDAVPDSISVTTEAES